MKSLIVPHARRALNFLSAAACAFGLLGTASGAEPTTTLVSKATGGAPPQCPTPETFCYSVMPDITPNGRYVVFSSVVQNIVPGPHGPTSRPQILRHDLHTCTTVRISETAEGEPANWPAWNPAISADGSVVAFTSRATNLVAGVQTTFEQVYVFDESTGQMELISRSEINGAPANEAAAVPLVSDDGRWIIFQSAASNLVPGDTNGQADIFAFDRQFDELRRISVNANSEQANGVSARPHMSSDGRFVTFDSTATNLTGDSFTASPQAFLLDRDANETGVFDEPGGTSLTLVSINTQGDPANASVFWPTVSDDGDLIAMTTTASNLAPNVTNGVSDIFVHNRANGQTTRESVGPTGQQTWSGTWFPTRFSSDGRYLTFHSPAQELVIGGHNGMTHVFRRDLWTGENVIVSRNSDGELADWSSEVGVPNATGEIVAFTSGGNNLIPGGSTNPNWVNVYVRKFRPADFNGDGVVDVSDLLMLLSKWGAGTCSIADLNGDAAVDVSDLLILLSAWGQ